MGGSLSPGLWHSPCEPQGSQSDVPWVGMGLPCLDDTGLVPNLRLHPHLGFP